MKQRIFAVAMIFLVLMVVVFGSLAVKGPVEQAEAQYSVPCHMEQGGEKFVAESGCEIGIQSGATFDLQSGATTDFSAGADLDGATLVLDADGDTSMVASSDDIITTTVATTTGYLVVATGNVKIGNGTPGETQDGEDLYVEGIAEVDGAAYFDGAVDMDSTLGVSGALTVESGGVDVQSGDITLENDETIGNNTNGLIDFGGGLIYNTTTITVTDGETITPTTYTGYRLNAASEVTITLAACSSDFQPLFLYGEDAQTINVADSDIRTSDGNAIAFDQYDVVEWQCVNSEWNLVYEANNQ